MSVHKALTEHAKKQNKKFTDFLALDQRREEFISEAIELCKQGKDFSTEKINYVTNQINNLAEQVCVPTRKLVTPDMVQEYVLTLK
jgi:hypothetical protein